MTKIKKHKIQEVEAVTSETPSVEAIEAIIEEPTPVEVIEEEPELEASAFPAPELPIGCYKLKALMNVRDMPMLSGNILGTAPTGTIVDVYEIDHDWMRVYWEGKKAYILYDGGNYAQRI